MKRIFIDTNILIDLLLKREGYTAAANILTIREEKIVSVLTMANIAYILRKTLKGDSLYAALEKLSNLVSVESLTTKDYQDALNLKAVDFEDALQYFCAYSSGCDVIITRNKKDFTFSRLPVLSPDEYLND